MGVVVEILVGARGRSVHQAHGADTDVELNKDGVEVGELVWDDGRY